jgi:hypothetical protein
MLPVPVVQAGAAHPCPILPRTENSASRGAREGF